MPKRMLAFASNEQRLYFEEKVFKSVRTLALQKLLFLTWLLMASPENSLCKRARARVSAKRLPMTPFELASELVEEDVIGVIGCSKRTATDYVQTLQRLASLMDWK